MAVARYDRSCIDPAVFAGRDAEFLADLVMAAVAEAQRRAADLLQAEMRKVPSLPFVAALTVSAIDALITELARLPGIGRKTAQRLTFHLLQQPSEQAGRLAAALVAVSERVRPCDECGNLTEEQPCAICRDPRRDAALLCVVEESSTVPVVDRVHRLSRAAITSWAAGSRRSTAWDRSRCGSSISWRGSGTAGYARSFWLPIPPWRAR